MFLRSVFYVVFLVLLFTSFFYVLFECVFVRRTSHLLQAGCDTSIFEVGFICGGQLCFLPGIEFRDSLFCQRPTEPVSLMERNADRGGLFLICCCFLCLLRQAGEVTGNLVSALTRGVH